MLSLALQCFLGPRLGLSAAVFFLSSIFLTLLYWSVSTSSCLHSQTIPDSACLFQPPHWFSLLGRFAASRMGKSKKKEEERQIKREGVCVGTAEVIIAYVAGMELYDYCWQPLTWHYQKVKTHLELYICTSSLLLSPENFQRTFFLALQWENPPEI